jgi:16S rRNA (guanine527-N7)-methyltransferase
MNAVDITLDRGIEALGLGLTVTQTATLERYLDLLEKWNRVYNLTAIRDRAQMLTHHLLDSLAVVPHVRGPRVLDVGTGGGLPGIPIAIACPAMTVTLLDSNHKKTAFLNQAAAELPLPNVRVSAERIEAWDAAERFETIVSRAFSDLAEFVTASSRLLADGGRFVAMKGVHPFEEIERLPAGFVVNEVVKLHVPGLDAERHLVIVGRA